MDVWHVIYAMLVPDIKSVDFTPGYGKLKGTDLFVSQYITAWDDCNYLSPRSAIELYGLFNELIDLPLN